MLYTIVDLLYLQMCELQYLSRYDLLKRLVHRNNDINIFV